MATFDLDDILKRAHRIIENNVDYPTSGEDDYEYRMGLCNDYIDEWNKEEGVNWKELWAMASVASTSATSYNLSSTVSNLDFPGGYVKLVPSTGSTVYWEVKKIEDINNFDNNQDPWCYFLGDPNNGYTLYFNPNYYPGAGTIEFPYYKKATHLSSGTDKPEMSDPSYLVHMIASQGLAEDNPGDSDKHFTIGQSRLKAMKTRNITPPEWQSDRLQDRRGVGLGY